MKLCKGPLVADPSCCCLGCSDSSWQWRIAPGNAGSLLVPSCNATLLLAGASWRLQCTWKILFSKRMWSSLPSLFGSKLKPSTNMHPDNSVNFPQGEMFSYCMYLTLLPCNPEGMLLHGQFLPFASVRHLKLRLALIIISLFKRM